MYQDVIAKDLYKQIQKLQKDRARYNARIVDMKVCDGTNRFWKARAASEQATNEIELLINRAVELDRQTDYLSKLHQDRFKFVVIYAEVHEMICDAKKASVGSTN